MLLELFQKNVSFHWYIFLILFFCHFFVLFLFNYLIDTSKLAKYEAVQKLHIGYIPRVGGLISFIGLVIFLLLPASTNDTTHFLGIALVYFLPILLITLKEDFFHNTSPYTRLSIMFFSLFFFFFNNELTFSLDLPLIGDMLSESKILSSFFFTISVVVIMNGNNLIDGVNGLMAMTNIFILISLLYLSINYYDFEIANISIFLLVSLFIFLLFNYPYGKLFLGDLGPYFFGFIISLLIIRFFNSHPDILAWNAMLILIYPAFELLFSFLRKIYSKKSPFKPDTLHLHIKLFYLLKSCKLNTINKTSLINALVMPLLSLIWLLPFVFLVIFNKSFYYVIFSIILYILVYISMFNIISKVEKD